MSNETTDVGSLPPANRGDQGLEAARRVLKNSVLQGAGDAVAKVSAFVFYALVARELGAHGFGEFTLVTSLVLFIEIGGLGTDMLLIREIAREQAAIGRLFWSAAAVRAGGGAAIAAAILLIGAFGDFSAEFLPALALMSVAWIADLEVRTVLGTLRGLEIFAPATIVAVVQRVGTTAATAVVLSFGDGLVAVCAVYLAGTAAALALSLALMYRQGVRPAFRIGGATMRWLVVEALPLGTSQVFSAALARFDMLILAAFASTAAVGVYGAAYRLFEGVSFISWAIGLAVMPMLSRATRSSTPTAEEVFLLAAKAIAVVMAPIATTMAVFPEPLIRLFFGAGYEGGAAAMAWLGVAVAVYGPFALATFCLAANDRYRIFPWAIGGTLVLNVGLNLYAAPTHGVTGVACVMAISQVVMTAVMLLATRRTIGGLGGRRPLLGPGAGIVAMVATALAVPWSDGLALLASLAAYVIALVSVERVWFRDDLRAAFAIIR